jgi:flagellin-like protein
VSPKYGICFLKAFVGRGAFALAGGKPSDPRPRRRGISPIISTVLLITITLVATTAIGGFAFGIFSSSADTAQVEVTRTAVPAVIGVGVTYAYCAISTGNSVGDGIIELYNSGTAGASADLLTFVYDGATVPVTLTGPCTIMPESEVYVLLLALPYQVDPGIAYTGYVTTSNGAEVLFTGAFQ